jgi:hypothetical protein
MLKGLQYPIMHNTCYDFNPTIFQVIVDYIIERISLGIFGFLDLIDWIFICYSNLRSECISLIRTYIYHQSMYTHIFYSYEHL